MKLNLGCWGDYRAGWANVEHPKQKKTAKADIWHDLNKFPYPFKDNSADEILMSHVFEHLNDHIRVIDECWRVLKPTGKLTIQVPHSSYYAAWGDLTHTHAFTSSSLHGFIYGSDFNYYSDKKWDMLSTKLFWRRPRGKRVKRVVRAMNSLVTPFLNIWPGFSEAIAPFIGGISEVEWVMRPRKGRASR